MVELELHLLFTLVWMLRNKKHKSEVVKTKSQWGLLYEKCV